MEQTQEEAKLADEMIRDGYDLETREQVIGEKSFRKMKEMESAMPIKKKKKWRLW